MLHIMANTNDIKQWEKQWLQVKQDNDTDRELDSYS